MPADKNLVLDTWFSLRYLTCDAYTRSCTLSRLQGLQADLAGACGREPASLVERGSSYLALVKYLLDRMQIQCQPDLLIFLEEPETRFLCESS